MNHYTNEELLDDDDGYREWAETIEQQNREAQDAEADQVAAKESMQVIDLSHLSWAEVLSEMTNPGSDLNKKLRCL